MNKPIFILGAPRSGTTFLASLLENTEYGAPFETHFITKYYKQLSNYGDINEYEKFQILLTDILNERAVRQWNLNLDSKKIFKELGVNFTYAQLVNKICLIASHKKGYELWGDKTPNYLEDIDVLYELFPDSKYIYIIRDGRDVALSLLEKDWGPNNVYYCAKYWASLNQDHIYLKSMSSSNNLYQLKYEDLLDNVEEYVKEIYSFLNLKYDEDVISRLAGTVKSRNYNKWKRYMTSRQIKTFDRVASGTLRRFGYEVSTEEVPISSIWKIIYFLHNLVYRTRHLFIINVVDGIKIKYFGKEPFAE
jgi:hypothetical protein